MAIGGTVVPTQDRVALLLYVPAQPEREHWLRGVGVQRARTL